jgi:hypothetical protein
MLIVLLVLFVTPVLYGAGSHLQSGSAQALAFSNAPVPLCSNLRSWHAVNTQYRLEPVQHKYIAYCDSNGRFAHAHTRHLMMFGTKHRILLPLLSTDTISHLRCNSRLACRAPHSRSNFRQCTACCQKLRPRKSMNSCSRNRTFAKSMGKRGMSIAHCTWNVGGTKRIQGRGRLHQLTWSTTARVITLCRKELLMQ